MDNGDRPINDTVYRSYKEKARKDVIDPVKSAIDNKQEWKAKHKLSNEDIVVKSVSGTFPDAINLLKKDGSNLSEGERVMLKYTL